jgi:hypothetical protein
MLQDEQSLYITQESQLRWAYRKKLNITWLYDPTQDNEYTFGVRLTPWGRNPEGIMYYGGGVSVLIAFCSAVAAFGANDELSLDYDYRGYAEDTDNETE